MEAPPLKVASPVVVVVPLKSELLLTVKAVPAAEKVVAPDIALVAVPVWVYPPLVLIPPDDMEAVPISRVLEN